MCNPCNEKPDKQKEINKEIEKLEIIIQSLQESVEILLKLTDK